MMKISFILSLIGLLSTGCIDQTLQKSVKETFEESLSEVPSNDETPPEEEPQDDPPKDPPVVARSFGVSAMDYSSGVSIDENELSSDFISGSLKVRSSSHWGAGSTNQYISADNYEHLIAWTRDKPRDVEVEGWSRNGIMYVRMTDSGEAIFLSHNGEVSNGQIQIGIAKGVTPESGQPDSKTIIKSFGNATSSIPGYDKLDTENDTFVLGVSGFEVYAKFNGVEFYRSNYEGWRHMKSGRAAFRGHTQASYGFRHMRVRILEQKQGILSDYENNQFNAIEFGIKSFKANGSINAGSKTLVLNSNPGFKVGDYLIIEIGGEAGRGARGTAHGVGGFWPKTAVNTASDLDSLDMSQGYAYVHDEQAVYRTWPNDPRFYKQNKYYHAAAIPLPLEARVTTVNGNVLTLDTAAVNSAVNANVYFDNSQAFFTKMLETDSYAPAPRTLTLPKGEFVFARGFDIEEDNSVLEGMGKYYTTIKTVKGRDTPTINIRADQAEVRDFTIIGTSRDQGYGPGNRHNAISFLLSSESIAKNIRCIDVANSCISGSRSTNVWAYEIDDYMNDGLLAYVQWKFQWPDSSGGGCVDCKAVSPRPHGGFESFSSRDVSFIRANGYNLTSAINSAGGTVFEEPYFYFEKHTEDERWNFSQGNAVMNINDNLNRSGLLSLGQRISNPVIAFEGPIDEEGSFLRGITLAHAQIKKVEISGGLYYIPDQYRESFNQSTQGIALNGDADSHHRVEGFRSLGSVNPDRHPGGDIVLKTDASGFIRECVADNIKGNSAELSFNMTNEEYQSNQAPNASPIAKITVKPIKGAGSYHFFANDSTDSDGKIIKYEWSFSDGGTDVTRFASHQFKPGDHTVILKITDDNGATDVVSKNISVP